MKWPLFLIVFGCITFCSAQDVRLSEYDLYGCWIREKWDKENRPYKLIYRRCKDVSPSKSNRSSQFVLQAYSKSEVQTDSPNICFTTVTKPGTWKYNPKNELLTIYYGHDFVQEAKAHDEEFADFLGDRTALVWERFLILNWNKDTLEVEILSKGEESALIDN